MIAVGAVWLFAQWRLLLLIQEGLALVNERLTIVTKRLDLLKARLDIAQEYGNIDRV